MAALFRTADDVINQKIFEKSLDLILVTNRTGVFVRVSPSSMAILGYQPAEMVGRSAEEFIYPPDLEHTRQMMRDQHRLGVTRHFDCSYVHRSGKSILLTWTGVWSEEEGQDFFIGRDITNARTAEQYQAIAQEVGSMEESIKVLQEKIDDTGENKVGVII